MDVDKPAFYTERAEHEFIFKEPLQLRHTYVTDRFKNLIEEDRLTGFHFTLVWSDDPTLDPQPPKPRPLPKIINPDIREEALNEEDLSLIEESAEEGYAYLNLPPDASPEAVVEAIGVKIDELRNDEKLSDAEGKRLCAMLGALWGEQVRRAYDWHWARLYDGDNKMFAIVTPDASAFVTALNYMWQFLLNKERDSTIELLFNMLSAPHPQAEPGGYLAIE